MFATSPVIRLSIPTTEKPRSSRYSLRCDPRNPAAPVTKALGILVQGDLVQGHRRRAKPDSLRRSARGLRRGGGAAPPSISMVLAEAVEQREDQDLQVEPQRPVLDVVEIELDALLDRGVAAPAVHLRPARHAALDAVAAHVLGDP